MPRTYVVDHERDAIWVSVSGVFTEEEFRTGTDATVHEPGFHRSIRTLVDFSAVTEFKISAKALEEFVLRRFFSKDSRRAFVVGSGFGESFVEFGKILGAEEQIRVFHCVAEALAWLNEGCPPEKSLNWPPMPAR
jgi:hypothetical protein